MLRHSLVIALLLTGALCSAKDKDKHSDHFLPAGPIHLDKAGQKWADKTLRRMSPEEKVGQLFSTWVRVQFLNDADPIFVQLRDNIRKYHIGSVVMSVCALVIALRRSNSRKCPFLAASISFSNAG